MYTVYRHVSDLNRSQAIPTNLIISNSDVVFFVEPCCFTEVALSVDQTIYRFTHPPPLGGADAYVLQMFFLLFFVRHDSA